MVNAAIRAEMALGPGYSRKNFQIVYTGRKFKIRTAWFTLVSELDKFIEERKAKSNNVNNLRDYKII